jgi:hypothetical protein
MTDDAPDRTSSTPESRAAPDDGAARSGNGPTDASTDSDDATFEKWLVRFFLFLVFGVAFGIEGRTLIQTYLSSDDDPAGTDPQPAETVRRVGTGDALLPDLPARVRSMQLTASTTGDWTYRLTVVPGSLGTDTLSLSVDRLVTNNEDALSAKATHTWASGDTTALAATWSIPPGSQPNHLHVTTRYTTSDTTRVRTDTLALERTPVQMQQ